MMADQALVEAMETALADAVGHMAHTAGTLDAIETALAEALHRLSEKHVIDFGPLVQALSAMRPVVNVNVPQAQVHIAGPAKFKVTIEGAYGEPDRVMLIERQG